MRDPGAVMVISAFERRRFGFPPIFFFFLLLKLLLLSACLDVLPESPPDCNMRNDQGDQCGGYG